MHVMVTRMGNFVPCSFLGAFLCERRQFFLCKLMFMYWKWSGDGYWGCGLMAWGRVVMLVERGVRDGDTFSPMDGGYFFFFWAML